MKTYGLIGRNISYSFSREYFREKFEKENIPATYQNFDLENLDSFRSIFSENPQIEGLNVTIPYKEEIIPYLDHLDPVAGQIGAVNTIRVGPHGLLTGFNTDYYGFIESIRRHLKEYHLRALILGTGGASKAIAYGLGKLGINYQFVSRSPEPGELNYSELSEQHFDEFKVIINSTPLGTFPNINAYPPIPAQHLTPQHLVYDLIYNPAVTQLMKMGLEKKSTVVNGLEMLKLQAEKAWEIWTFQE